jgi:hypothetical protein
MTSPPECNCIDGLFLELSVLSCRLCSEKCKTCSSNAVTCDSCRSYNRELPYCQCKQGFY